uniref:SWIM-type domain-containing protein n=1 Tax=Strongyloides stercoralis TaxID=6248 RepID=A0A0K0E482_STRER
MDRIYIENVKWKDFNSFTNISHIKQDNKRKPLKNIKIPSLFDFTFSIAIKYFTFNEIYNTIEETFNKNEIVNINEYFTKYGFPMNYSNIHKLWILNGVSFQTFNIAVNYYKTNKITSLLQCGTILFSTIIDVNLNDPNDIENANLAFNKHKICIKIDKCRLVKSFCTCNYEKRSMCSHVIATCLEKMLYPEKVKIIAPNANELITFLIQEGIQLDETILYEFDWNELMNLSFNKITIKNNKNYYLESRTEFLNKSTDKTINETMMYFEKAIEKVLEYIDEMNGLNFFLYTIENNKSIVYNTQIMEEYISNYFKLENVNYLSFYSKDVQNVYEIIKELVYSNEECGFYGSVYFLLQCFSSSRFSQLFIKFIQYYNIIYTTAFSIDSSLTEPTFNFLRKKSKYIDESVRANIIGHILLECVKNIRRYIYIKNISKDDLEGIKNICFLLNNKYKNILFQQSEVNLTNKNYLTNLYNPISSLLLDIIEEIKLTLKSEEFVSQRKLYKYNNNNLLNNYEKRNYNLSYGLKKIMNICKISYEEGNNFNNFDIYDRNNLFNSVIEDKISNYELFDIPILQEFNSLTSMRLKSSRNINSIKNFIKYWNSLENIIKLFVTYNKSQNIKIHLPHRSMKKTYDQFYECISLIYNMTYNEVNRMIYTSTPLEICDLLYTTMILQRTFLYDYLQEIHLWSFQNKLLNVFKILINTKDKKKEVIKYFSQRIDTFVEIFNLEKIHEPGCLINCYLISMVAKICSDNVNDCTNFSTPSKNYVKKCFNKILFNYLEYNPNISSKTYFNFLQIFYEDKARFVVEIIKSNRGCSKFLDEIMNKILLTKYGHLYSNDKSNCYTINEKLCKHLKANKIEVAPMIYSFYILKILQYLCMNKNNGIYYWKLNDNDIEVKDINNKNSNIYHISLLLAVYGSCINQRNGFLSNEYNLLMTMKIFSPKKFSYTLPIIILEKIDANNCLSPSNFFDLTFKTLKSKYSDIRNRGMNILLNMLRKVYNLDIKRVGQLFYILERKRNDMKALKVARKNVIIAFKKLCEKYTKSEYYMKNYNNNLVNVMVKENDWRYNIFLSVLKGETNTLHTFILRSRTIISVNYETLYEDTFLIIKDLYRLKNEIESSTIKNSLELIQLENGLKFFCRNIKNNIAGYDTWWNHQRVRGEIFKITYLICAF